MTPDGWKRLSLKNVTLIQTGIVIGKQGTKENLDATTGYRQTPGQGFAND